MNKHLKMEAIYACRLCFATDIKLFNIHHVNLSENIKTILAFNISTLDTLPPYVCFLCANLIKKYVTFINKCKLSHNLLQEYKEQCEQKSPTSMYADIHRTIKQHNYNTTKTTIADICINKYIEMNDTCKVFDNEAVSEDDSWPSPYEQNDIEKKIKTEPDVSDDDRPLVEVKNTKKLKKAKRRKSFQEDFAKVIHLTKEEQRREIEIRKNGLNYLNSPFKCEICFKGFVEKKPFNNHMERHDESSGKHVCDICFVRCNTRTKLRTHKITNHEKKFACNQCDSTCNTAAKAREHERWHRGHTYTCKYCGESFKKVTTHLTHVRIRHPSDFVCDICGESFLSEHGLHTHKKRMHRDEELTSAFKCNACNTVFKSLAALNNHKVIGTHDESHGKACRECGDNLATTEELVKHMRTHTEELARCEECNAQFPTPRKCADHFKRIHLGIKYVKHNTSKNVVCEICGRRCMSNAALVTHQRTHTGEKPFQCGLCPKRFSVQQRLQIHTRTHTGERPYSCAQCPKAFRHKPALNRHLRVHSGDKPYTCRYCGKSFSQSNSMKLHIHTVHLKLPPPYRNKAKQ